MKPGDVLESAELEGEAACGGVYLLLRRWSSSSRPAWDLLILCPDRTMDEAESAVDWRTETWLLEWCKPLGSGAQGDAAARAFRAGREAEGGN